MNIKVISIERQSDRPAKNSPVGLLVSKLIEKNPGMEFEEARKEANRLLRIAAGKWNYKIPKVYSPEEKAAFKARMQAASRKAKDAA